MILVSYSCYFLSLLCFLLIFESLEDFQELFDSLSQLTHAFNQGYGTFYEDSIPFEEIFPYYA